MRIRHIFPTTSSRKEVDVIPAFFLSNQNQNMLSLYTERQTRYEGWYVKAGQTFTRLLERIEVLNEDNIPSEIVGITNTGFSSFWEYQNGLKLGWKLLNTLSGLSIRASKQTRLRICLDIRSIHVYPQFDRTYTAEQDTTGTLVTYTDALLKEPVFVHIRSRQPIELLRQWVPQEYSRDTARHSPPDRLFTYILGTVISDQLSFGYGLSKEEALENSLAATKQRPNSPQVGMHHTMDTLLSQVNTARASVNQALRWLTTEDGIWAGLPWFNQVWSRDELITTLGLQRDRQREVIEQYLGKPLLQGELPTFTGSHTTCSDGVGWLCLLVREYGEENLPFSTQERLRHFLLKARQELIASRAGASGFILSGHNTTWMDTIGREGYRLEIQCMYGLLLELLYSLTKENTYKQEQLRFIAAIRQHFWKDGCLYDGIGDSTKRPNVFLAYLLQPNLLSQNLWQSCFDSILKATLLPWGGLSSVDQKSPLYHPSSTGQDNQSYHQGDSWFFINNLAGVALQRFNKRRYGNVVTGILESSTEEILWHNMIGQPGEISSAESLNSWGCGIQAFSGGAYLMLLRELEGYSAGQERDSISFFWDSTTDSSLDTLLK